MVALGTQLGVECSRRVPVIGALRAALERAAADPGLTVEVFETTWAGVDRARRAVDDQGLSARVRVRHVGAMEIVRQLGRPALRAA